MQWYYAEKDQQQGPVNEDEFNRLCASGTITPRTLVWNQTMTDWQKLQDTDFFKADLPDTDPASGPESLSEPGTADNRKQCTQCGKTLPADELAAFGDQLICAACKPVFLQKMREGVSTGKMVYGGFWIRFAAKFVDGLIMGLLSVVMGFVFGFAFSAVPMGSDEFTATLVPGIINSLLQWIVGICYVVFFVGKYAATPGKMLCGLKIVTPDGGRVSYARAFGRYFAEILSSIILCIGFIMAAFDSEKRTLHDRICATRVIKKQ